MTAVGERTASARSELVVEAMCETPLPWDVFVRAASDSSFCHLWAWRRIMSDVLGHETLYLAALDRDGAWRGVLPLVHVRSRLAGSYLISLPFLNAGGPIGSDEACHLLAEWAVEEARTRRVDLLELRGRRALGAPLAVSSRKITVVLDLPSTADELWQRFPPKLRSQIRRPEKVGLEARFGLDQVEGFYRVFARHMRDLGTPVLPLSFFEGIVAAFPDQAMLGVVYRGAEPVAAGCGFCWGHTFEITWASALTRYAREAPNMLLYWGAMRQAIARNMRRFDFGRCTRGSGTHRFKLQWGGHEIPLPWSQWSASGTTAPPTPERLRYRVAAGVWKRLPLPVTNSLGPRLARILP